MENGDAMSSVCVGGARPALAGYDPVCEISVLVPRAGAALVKGIQI